MKKYFAFLLPLVASFILTACQKEFSFEKSDIASAGSLQSDAAGDCLPKTVQGIYEAGTVLNGTANYIDVQVNVTGIGLYRVFSDTVNGMFFQASGEFETPGLNTVRLPGNGTPLAEGIHNFTITYDSTQCIVAVSTLAEAAAVPAAFTLSGAPNTCLDYNLSGAYIKDVELTIANTVVIKVNVTAIGTYSIATTVSNGITFSGTGALTALGDQTITLTATGTPAATGSTNIAVTAGSSSCSFAVEVVGPASFTIDCASAFVDGTYQEGVALGASNTVDINVNVTAPGAYTITTTAVNGMSFSGSGNLTGGPQTIRLTGSGTPTADGTFDINISAGGSSCAFEVVVDPGVPATDLQWKFTSGSTTYQGTTDVADLTTDNGATTLDIFGDHTNGFGELSLSLINTSGAISTGIYSGTALLGKLAAFIYSDTGIDWIAFPSSGSNLPINLTVFNTATKIAEGTFSGTAKDAAGNTITISNGSFKSRLP